MLDDFFVRALIAGIGLALVAGPLGCFVVWRRMAYFGDTVSHAALLGVALSFATEMPVMAGVFLVAVAVALALYALQAKNPLPADALLGILSHSTLAIGLIIVSFMTWVRIDLMAFLFGDILAVTRGDVAVIILGGGAIAAGLVAMWRPLLTASVSRDLAAAEGLKPDRASLAFMIMIACVIAIAMKIVGIILITALLIIPAAAARRFAASPEGMAVAASAIGALAVVVGLAGSLQFDTPSGPSIVAAAFALFLAGLLPVRLLPRGAAGRGRNHQEAGR